VSANAAVSPAGIFTVAKLGYDAASIGIAYYECGK